MAAEEAFVYACATRPDVCDIDFEVSAEGLNMSFSLGDAAIDEEPAIAEQVGLAQVLLSAVSDSYEVSPDGSMLRATKLVGAVHGI
ncbi:MAG: hypothetical protein IKG18_14970 [Atopobiaceae bacterium]|nr:hypothetical protein [Atopobiaceae bacterium]MBR3315427.1 hypothetical protein [Atopobiaceae bacterium]